MDKKFNIKVVCDINFSIKEIWPDGDAPVNPTAQDVIDTMKEDCGSIRNLLSEWWFPSKVTVWNNEDKSDSATWDEE